MSGEENDLSELILFLDSIIDNIPHMIFIKDAKSLKFVKLNKAAESLLGIKVKDMLGKSDYDFFPKKQADFFIQKDKDVLNSKTLLDISVEEINSKTLGKIYLNTKKIPLLNKKKEPVYLLGISENITEKIEHEQKILQLNKTLEQKVAQRTQQLANQNKLLLQEIARRKEVEKQLNYTVTRNRLLLQSTAEGIYGVDIKGAVTFVNKAAEKMLGYAEGELLGKPIVELAHHHDRKYETANYSEKTSPIAGSFMRGKTHREINDHMWRKDNTSFPVEYVSSPIFDDNKLIGAVVIFNDITERKNIEKDLWSTAYQLSQSNQSLDAFAYTASHDLKAPLRAIERLSSWISEDAEEQLDEKSKANLATLRKRVIRMSNLIDGILQYSRIGRMDEEICTVDTARLLDEIIDSINPEKKFTIRYANNLPVFQTNKTPLQQVFSNLICNAITHHDKETGLIEISCHDRGDYYEFLVADDGPGIEPEYFEKIFQIFQTLQSKDCFESTGIGLSIVKKTVELRGGKVSIESNKNKGTIFHFTWPKVLSHEF